jgi:hypothetical protein
VKAQAAEVEMMHMMGLVDPMKDHLTREGDHRGRNLNHTIRNILALVGVMEICLTITSTHQNNSLGQDIQIDNQGHLFQTRRMGWNTTGVLKVLQSRIERMIHLIRTVEKGRTQEGVGARGSLPSVSVLWALWVLYPK